MTEITGVVFRAICKTLNYNKDLRNLGAEAFVDVWGVHYYSKNFETVVTKNGVGDFFGSLSSFIE